MSSQLHLGARQGVLVIDVQGSGFASDLGVASMARSTLTDFKAPFILKGDFTPYFPLKLMHKDLELAMEAGFAQNVPMPALAAVKEVYSAAKAQGKGDLDYASVITYLEELAGVKVRKT